MKKTTKGLREYRIVLDQLVSLDSFTIPAGSRIDSIAVYKYDTVAGNISLGYTTMTEVVDTTALSTVVGNSASLTVVQNCFSVATPVTITLSGSVGVKLSIQLSKIF